MPKCCVVGWTSGYAAHPSDTPVQWFLFPKEESMRRKWILRVNRVNFDCTDTTQICSLHFTRGEYLSLLPEMLQGKIFNF